MRALWCTAIAVCFMAGGIRPIHGSHIRRDTSTLRVAASTHVSSARRASADLGPLVAPAAPRALTVRQHVSELVLPAPVSPEPRVALSSRSSRGPPDA